MYWLWDANKPSWFNRTIEFITCGIWGHEAGADCSLPEHDYCIWCLKGMPNAFNREPA